MSKLCKSLVLFVLGISTFSYADIKKTPYSKTVTIAQWQVIDLVINAKIKEKNQFTVNFSGIFTGPKGEKMKIPGFYNGGNEWIIRFSASEVGSWAFTTESELKQLSGKKGAITIVKSTDSSKHGGIVTRQENPQHFYYEDGTPYFQLAFECDWLFALDYHNNEAAPKTSHLLDLLLQNKINQIVTTAYSFDVEWEKDPKLAKHPEHEFGGDLTIYPFLGTNEAPDFSQLNVEFFQQFDRTISLMDDRNIVAHLMIYVWNKLVSWPEAETEADNMYFDYIIKRYQAFPNIVWDVSKEALNNARCTEEYGLERIARIRKLDAFERLVSVHDYGFCNRNSEAVDFISSQNWTLTIHASTLEMYKKFPDKPIFNIEHGGYEVSPYNVFPGNYISPEYCLRRNYEISFAGAYSTYYWQGTSWNAIIYNPFEQPDDFVKPRFDYYKHYVEFFTKFPFSDFSPGTGISTFNLTDNNGTYLVYVPKETYEISIYGKSPLAGTGTFQWFNTLTGKYTESASYEGGQCINPWHENADAILIRKH